MPSPSEDRPVPPPGSAEEALRRLEQRLDRASEAAERLMAEAAAAAAGHPSTPSASAAPPSSEGEAGEAVKPPPSGWQIPGDSGAGARDSDPFIALAQALRDLIPPELQQRLVGAIRELLLALRALIDWYLERSERRREEAVDVQDIPIL